MNINYIRKCILKNINYPKIFFIFFTIVLYPHTLYALDIFPFTTSNQSPLIRIYGLPSPGNAIVTPVGKIDFQMALDLANNYIDDTAGRERIVLDGEGYQMKMVAIYGIAKGVECGIEIPYIVQTGGLLDGFIESYHSTFGFPQGGRDQAPKGRLLFQYQRNGIDRLKIDTSNSGFGDLRLTSAFQLYQSLNEGATAFALRTSLKLPTGDSGQLYGSGSTDLAVWLTASDDHKFSYGHSTIYGAVGAMVMTEGKVLESQQRRAVGFGNIGAGWSPATWIAFKIQIDGHTAFYNDSELVELSGHSVQFTIGGTLAMSKQITIDIGVTEDIIIKTSPDVVFHVAVKSRF